MHIKIDIQDQWLGGNPIKWFRRIANQCIRRYQRKIRTATRRNALKWDKRTRK